MFEGLCQEIERLEQWAVAHAVNEYPFSEPLYDAVEIALKNALISDDLLRLLLHALALDEEAERIQDALRERPVVARQVARAAVEQPDYRARWQAAVLAGEVAEEEVVSLYLDDPDEYVRRRALLAARDRFPGLVEAKSMVWLDSPYAYSRMVALDTLYAIKSKQYRVAVDRLEQDTSSVVRVRLNELEGAQSKRRDA